jgi:hypothetical protein
MEVNARLQVEHTVTEEVTGQYPELEFKSFYANVFNLRSFELSPDQGLSLSTPQSHSPLCVATQISDSYWSSHSMVCT